MLFVAALVVLDTLTLGLLTGLGAIPGRRRREEEPMLPPAIITDTTAAPVSDERGLVQCTRCAELVEYASMSLDENGYFCAPCAAALVAAATNE